jgi:acyl-CoA synthetase (AMP-forming)/AMP-acid ligase II
MIINSTFPEVDIPDLTLPEYVLGQAAGRGAKPAIVDGGSGRVLTYADLAAGVCRCAAGLAAAGLRPGDVSAIMIPNLPEFAIAYHGALTAGGVVTTLSPLATADEAAYQLAETSARFLLTVPRLGTPLTAADKAGVERVFVLGAAAPGASAFSELLGHGDTPPVVRADPARDLAAVLCSSGTSGWPKGVMLTHRALVAALVELDRLAPFGEQERPICPIPFFHVAGQAAGMNKVLRAGATVVTMPRFDVESFLALIQRYRVTAVLAAPPIVLALAKHPLVDRYDLAGRPPGGRRLRGGRAARRGGGRDPGGVRGTAPRRRRRRAGRSRGRARVPAPPGACRRFRRRDPTVVGGQGPPQDPRRPGAGRPTGSYVHLAVATGAGEGLHIRPASGHSATSAAAAWTYPWTANSGTSRLAAKTTSPTTTSRVTAGLRMLRPAIPLATLNTPTAKMTAPISSTERNHGCRALCAASGSPPAATAASGANSIPGSIA